MIFLANSFSFQMITNFPFDSHTEEITKEKFDYYKQHAVSYMGNEDLANLLDVDYNRESLKLRGGDVLLVAQLMGGKLPKGATELPHNVSIKYLCMQILKDKSENGLFETEITMEE